MKDTLAAVFIFCITLVIVTALCTLSFILYIIGSKLFLFPSISWEMIVALIPTALTQMFLPGTLLSLFLALIRMRRKPGIKVVSYFALGILAFAVLFLGPQLVYTSLTNEIKRVQAQTVIGIRDLSYPEKLIALKDSYLYFEKRNNSVLSSVLLIDMTKQAPHITPIDQAVISSSEKGASLTVPSSPGVIPVAPKAEEAAPFAPDASIQSIFQSFTIFNERFIALSVSKKAEFLIVCILFTAFILSSSFFLRITQWPLANIFITLLVLYVILVFYNFLAFSLVGELTKITGETIVLSFIPNGMLVIVSGFFFLLDFIFLPEKRGGKLNA